MKKTYLNGNVEVHFYDNGFKAYAFPERPTPDFPYKLSLRLIGNKVATCPHCFLKEEIKEETADSEYILDYFRKIPAGTEIDISGGNLIDYEPIWSIIKDLNKKHDLKVNLTLHENQLLSMYNIFKLADFQKNGYLNLIKILGTHRLSEEAKDVLKRVVRVLIVGIDDVDTLRKFENVLVMGFVKSGCGEKYFKRNKEEIEKNLERWKEKIDLYNNKNIKYNSLALKQLEKDFDVVPEDINTGYIDFVKNIGSMNPDFSSEFELTTFKNDFRRELNG